MQIVVIAFVLYNLIELVQVVETTYQMRPYISSLIVQHEKRLCAFQVIHGWMRSITVLDMLSPHIEDIFQSLNSS
jgi:hypothetical protein